LPTKWEVFSLMPEALCESCDQGTFPIKGLVVFRAAAQHHERWAVQKKRLK
jgi:hypothetical protein